MTATVARLQSVRRDAMFFVAEQLLDASSNAIRAGILLRLPDAVVAAKARQLQAACEETGFHLGTEYVAIRHGAQHARRDPRGNLPANISDQLEYWRSGMIALSEGSP